MPPRAVSEPDAARYLIFVHDGAGYEQLVDPRDYTNLDTRLDSAENRRARRGRDNRKRGSKRGCVPIWNRWTQRC